MDIGRRRLSNGRTDLCRLGGPARRTSFRQHNSSLSPSLCWIGSKAVKLVDNQLNAVMGEMLFTKTTDSASPDTVRGAKGSHIPMGKLAD